MDVHQTLATNVRRHLERLDWSANHLARKAGLGNSSLHRLISPDEGVTPTTRTVQRVAKTIGVPVWTLYIDNAPIDPTDAHRIDAIVRGLFDLDGDGLATVQRIIELEKLRR